jgi:hypothetical protein
LRREVRDESRGSLRFHRLRSGQALYDRNGASFRMTIEIGNAS